MLYRFRAERIVVATGALEQPLVFPGNDLVGVMLPDGVRRLVRDFSIKPGERAVVLGSDDETLSVADDLGSVGVAVSKVVDLRDSNPRELAALGGKGRVRRLLLDGDEIECDLLVASGGRQPAYSLLAQAGARIEYDEALGVFVPRDLPAGLEAVGSVTGEGLARAGPAPAYPGKGKCFVCICEDVTTKDLKRAIGEGFDSIELAKRYTTTTMGPCQGKLCHLASIRNYAHENRMYEAAIGTTTARPPWAPVELGLLAGSRRRGRRRTRCRPRTRAMNDDASAPGPSALPLPDVHRASRTRSRTRCRRPRARAGFGAPWASSPAITPTRPHASICHGVHGALAEERVGRERGGSARRQCPRAGRE